MYAIRSYYAVVLTLFGGSGSSPAVITKMVSLVNSPIPQFGTEVEYLTVSFSNTSTYGVSYSWDFGDGETSTDENPVHSYVITSYSIHYTKLYE